MRPFHRWNPLLVAALASLLLPALPAAAQQRQAGPVEFELYEPGVAAERLQAVGEAVGFNDWPRPETLFVAPPVSRELFAAPEQLGREVRACSPVRFAGEPWGRCEWSWRGSDEGKGWLDLSLTLAPTPRSAQEYLLAALSDNMLPVELAAATLREAARPEGLGDVAFRVSARDGDDVRLDFTRANLVVRIRARGTLAGAALDLARRLDARVLDQQPLSREGLLARRPTVELAAAVDAGALAYQVRLPGERPVVALRALAAGRVAPAVEGRVTLGVLRPEPTPVEVVVITADLLAAEALRELPAER